LTAQTIEDEYGTTSAVSAGQKTLQVDYKPVLVRSTS
jgi:hypothetical protein